jgi:hypothetical protein
MPILPILACIQTVARYKHICCKQWFRLTLKSKPEQIEHKDITNMTVELN